jgi:hypothetical protein
MTERTGSRLSRQEGEPSVSGEAVPDRAAPSGEPSAEALAEAFWFALHRRDAQSEGGWRSVGELWVEAMRTALRATPAEPGASPPHECDNPMACLVCVPNHPLYPAIVAGTPVAARSPAPAGDAPTPCEACYGTGLTDTHVTGIVECSHCDGSGEDPAGDAPREDALRKYGTHLSGCRLTNGGDRCTCGFETALRGAVSPSPGTRAAPTVGPSVVFREGPITAADYDEAIEALTLAKTQLEADPRGCIVCESDEHSAPTCFHNPLVLARRYAAVTQAAALLPMALPEDVLEAVKARWRCFHCGDLFTDEQAAREHFGNREDEVARCLSGTRAASEGEA